MYNYRAVRHGCFGGQQIECLQSSQCLGNLKFVKSGIVSYKDILRNEGCIYTSNKLIIPYVFQYVRNIENLY